MMTKKAHMPALVSRHCFQHSRLTQFDLAMVDIPVDLALLALDRLEAASLVPEMALVEIRRMVGDHLQDSLLPAQTKVYGIA